MNKASTLLYIHEPSFEMTERMLMVQRSGASVIGVPNYSGDDAVFKDRLFQIENTCDGVWIDVISQDATPTTRHLLRTAYEAGKPIIGRMVSLHQASQALEAYYGLTVPKDLVVTR